MNFFVSLRRVAARRKLTKTKREEKDYNYVMITPDQIDEWLKEIVQRPESAGAIIQAIAARLRDLSAHNEELLAENIALQTGKRVEEYERRIAHLEYQLDLLQRRFGADALRGDPDAAAEKRSEPFSLLVYDARGRIARVEIQPGGEASSSLPHLKGDLTVQGVPPGLLVVPPDEELLLVYSSGRVTTRPVRQIPLATLDPEGAVTWNIVPSPDKPRPAEFLACIAPVSALALAEFFVQASRRGYIKKIMQAMSGSILSNQYIGAGVTEAADKTFALALCGKADRIALVSREGWLAILEVGALPFSVEQAIRLAPTDHLAAAFVLRPGESALIMTQTGKAVYVEEEALELTGSGGRGRAIFSARRREAGVRVAGAAPARESGWAAGLSADGQLFLLPLAKLIENGAGPVESELLAFCAFTPDGA
jgi:DNA gyrase/topoisomerase IV subunit A